MKKPLYAVMLLLGLSMMISCGNNNQGKIEDNETSNTKVEERQDSSNTKVEVEVEPIDNSPRVYACAFDGFVNIRETPNAKAPILGVFRNGPEGAILLGSEGEWTKIDCNGIVGYVISKYVQDTATVAYTGTATIDDIAGVYFGGYTLFLWYDGTYSKGYNDITEVGSYILQNNEVILLPEKVFDMNKEKWIKYDSNADPEEKNLSIDLAHHKLGNGYEKQPFITKQEIDNLKLQFKKDIEKHDSDWEEDDWEEYKDQNLYGYETLHRLTKEDFKKKNLYKK